MGMEQITLRLSETAIEDAEDLVPWLSSQPYVAAVGTVNKSVVLRIAVERGLEVLKQERRINTSTTEGADTLYGNTGEEP